MATTQRERNAAQAQATMDARREDADGAAGWVAERAGQWDLEGVDDSFMDRQKYLWNPLMDYWFRMEIEDDDYVERKYDEVQQSIQDGMDTLARRRAFPIFG